MQAHTFVHADWYLVGVVIDMYTWNDSDTQSQPKLFGYTLVAQFSSQYSQKECILLFAPFSHFQHIGYCFVYASITCIEKAN